MNIKKISLIIFSLGILFPMYGYCEGSAFPNPIPYTDISEWLGAILNNLRGIVATLALIFIILGGVFYMLSAGDEGMIKTAKAMWTGAVIGMAIALAAPTFLKEIKAVLSSSGGGNGSAMIEGAATLQDIALKALQTLLSIIGIVGIISLVIGGGIYLTAYGDEDKIKTGKKVIQYAIAGIVVALSAIIIIQQLMTFIKAGS